MNALRLLILLAGMMLACQEPAFTDKEVQPGSLDQLPEKVGEGETPAGEEDPDDPAILPDDPNDPNDPDNPGDPNNPNDPVNPGDPGNPTTPTDPPAPQYIEVDQEFVTARLAKAEVQSDLDSATLSHAFTLQREYINHDRRERQVIRRPVSDQYNQGYLGFPITEDYIQSAQKKLDIIAVIDNSGSMKEEQVNLATKLSPLLSAVADTDWQIGVVTTDARDNCLRDLIKKGDADAATRFQNAVTAGTAGSSIELGVYQSKRALAGECDTGAWVREQSTIAVLIVSDEDNCSDGAGCSGKSYATKDYLLNYLAGIRVLGQTAKVYGLIWHPSQNGTQCSTGGYKGQIYSEMIADTNGAWGSICDADYSATLGAISQNIAETLAARFSLTYAPDQGSLKVYLDGVLQSSGYNVTGNVVTFAMAPVDGTAIRFDYLYNGKPIVSKFTLSKRPYNEALTVSIDGMAVLDSEYTYSAADNSIVFNQSPAERATIQVDYREAKDLKTEFSAPGDIVLETLKVYVENMPTTEFSYNPSKAVIVMNTPPAEGAELRFIYKARGNPIYTYPFLVNGAAPKDLAVVDPATGRAVTHLYILGHINILPFEFQVGRLLHALYYNDAREMTDVNLPTNPIQGTLVASDGTVMCRDITVKAQVATVKDCGFAKNSTKFTLTYDYIAERYTVFEFNMDNQTFDPEAVEWFVFINTQETQDYVRTGTTFTVNAATAYADKVTIRAKYRK